MLHSNHTPTQQRPQVEDEPRGPSATSESDDRTRERQFVQRLVAGFESDLEVVLEVIADIRRLTVWQLTTPPVPPPPTTAMTALPPSLHHLQTYPPPPPMPTIEPPVNASLLLVDEAHKLPDHLRVMTRSESSLSPKKPRSKEESVSVHFCDDIDSAAMPPSSLTRRSPSPLVPSGNHHQGDDQRSASCESVGSSDQDERRVSPPSEAHRNSSDSALSTSDEKTWGKAGLYDTLLRGIITQAASANELPSESLATLVRIVEKTAELMMLFSAVYHPLTATLVVELCCEYLANEESLLQVHPWLLMLIAPMVIEHQPRLHRGSDVCMVAAAESGGEQQYQSFPPSTHSNVCLDSEPRREELCAVERHKLRVFMHRFLREYVCSNTFLDVIRTMAQHQEHMTTTPSDPQATTVTVTTATPTTAMTRGAAAAAVVQPTGSFSVAAVFQQTCAKLDSTAVDATASPSPSTSLPASSAAAAIIVPRLNIPGMYGSAHPSLPHEKAHHHQHQHQRRSAPVTAGGAAPHQHPPHHTPSQATQHFAGCFGESPSPVVPKHKRSPGGDAPPHEARPSNTSISMRRSPVGCASASSESAFARRISMDIMGPRVGESLMRQLLSARSGKAGSDASPPPASVVRRNGQPDSLDVVRGDDDEVVVQRLGNGVQLFEILNSSNSSAGEDVSCTDPRPAAASPPPPWMMVDSLFEESSLRDMIVCGHKIGQLFGTVDAKALLRLKEEHDALAFIQQQQQQLHHQGSGTGYRHSASRADSQFTERDSIVTGLPRSPSALAPDGSGEPLFTYRSATLQSARGGASSPTHVVSPSFMLESMNGNRSSLNFVPPAATTNGAPFHVSHLPLTMSQLPMNMSYLAQTHHASMMASNSVHVEAFGPYFSEFAMGLLHTSTPDPDPMIPPSLSRSLSVVSPTSARREAKIPASSTSSLCSDTNATAAPKISLSAASYENPPTFAARQKTHYNGTTVTGNADARGPVQRPRVDAATCRNRSCLVAFEMALATLRLMDDDDPAVVPQSSSATQRSAPPITVSSTPLMLGFLLFDAIDFRCTSYLDAICRTIAKYTMDQEATLFSLFRDPTTLVQFPCEGFESAGAGGTGAGGRSASPPTAAAPSAIIASLVPKDPFLSLWNHVTSSIAAMWQDAPAAVNSSSLTTTMKSQDGPTKSQLLDALSWSLASLCHVVKRLPHNTSIPSQLAATCTSTLHDVMDLLRRDVRFELNFATCLHYVLELCDELFRIEYVSEALLAVLVHMFVESGSPVAQFLSQYCKRVATAEDPWGLFHQPRDGPNLTHQQSRDEQFHSFTVYERGADCDIALSSSTIPHAPVSEYHDAGDADTSVDTLFWPDAFCMAKHRVRLLYHYRCVAKFVAVRHNGGFLSLVSVNGNGKDQQHPVNFLLDPLNGLGLLILSDAAPATSYSMKLEVLRFLQEVCRQPAVVSPLATHQGWVATYTRFLYLAFLEAYHSRSFIEALSDANDAQSHEAARNRTVVTYTVALLRTLSALCGHMPSTRAWAAKLGIVRTLVNEIDLEQSVTEIRERHLKRATAAASATVTANTSPRAEPIEPSASQHPAPSTSMLLSDPASSMVMARRSPVDLSMSSPRVPPLSGGGDVADPPLLIADDDNDASFDVHDSKALPTVLSIPQPSHGAAGDDDMVSLTVSAAPPVARPPSTALPPLGASVVAESLGVSLIVPAAASPSHGSKPTLPFRIPKLSLAFAPPPLYYTSNGDTGAVVEATMNNMSFVRSGSFAFAPADISHDEHEHHDGDDDDNDGHRSSSGSRTSSPSITQDARLNHNDTGIEDPLHDEGDDDDDGEEPYGAPMEDIPQCTVDLNPCAEHGEEEGGEEVERVAESHVAVMSPPVAPILMLPTKSHSGDKSTNPLKLDDISESFECRPILESPTSASSATTATTVHVSSPTNDGGLIPAAAIMVGNGLIYIPPLVHHSPNATAPTTAVTSARRSTSRVRLVEPVPMDPLEPPASPDINGTGSPNSGFHGLNSPDRYDSGDDSVSPAVGVQPFSMDHINRDAMGLALPLRGGGGAEGPTTTTTGVIGDATVYPLDLVTNEAKFAAYQRATRRIYRDVTVQSEVIFLILTLLVSPNGSLDPLYTSSYTLRRKKVHTLFFLHMHLNHDANLAAVRELRNLVTKRLNAQNAAQVSYYQAASASTARYGSPSSSSPSSAIMASSEAPWHQLRHMNAMVLLLQLIEFRTALGSLYDRGDKIGVGGYGTVVAAQLREDPNVQQLIQSLRSGGNKSTTSGSVVKEAAPPPQPQQGGGLAIKICPVPHYMEDRDTLLNVFHEVVALNQVVDINGTAMMLDCGCDGTHYMLVMPQYAMSAREWRLQACSGNTATSTTTNEASIEDACLPPPHVFSQILTIFTSTIDVLVEVHKRRIAHCDIKADNLFLDWQATTSVANSDASFLLTRTCTVRIGDWGESVLLPDVVDRHHPYHHHQAGPRKSSPPRDAVLYDDNDDDDEIDRIFGAAMPPRDGAHGNPSQHFATRMVALLMRPRGTECTRPPEGLLPHRFVKPHLVTQLIEKKRDPAVLLQKADVWATGCLLFELVTGRGLFVEDQYGKMMHRVTTDSGELVPSSHVMAMQRMSSSTVSDSSVQLPSWYDPQRIGAALHRFLLWVLNRDLHERPTMEQVQVSWRQLLQEEGWVAQDLESIPTTTTVEASNVTGVAAEELSAAQRFLAAVQHQTPAGGSSVGVGSPTTSMSARVSRRPNRLQSLGGSSPLHPRGRGSFRLSVAAPAVPAWMVLIDPAALGAQLQPHDGALSAGGNRLTTPIAANLSPDQPSLSDILAAASSAEPSSALRRITLKVELTDSAFAPHRRFFIRVAASLIMAPSNVGTGLPEGYVSRRDCYEQNVTHVFCFVDHAKLQRHFHAISAERELHRLYVAASAATAAQAASSAATAATMPMSPASLLQGSSSASTSTTQSAADHSTLRVPVAFTELSHVITRKLVTVYHDALMKQGLLLVPSYTVDEVDLGFVTVVVLLAAVYRVPILMVLFHVQRRLPLDTTRINLRKCVELAQLLLVASAQDLTLESSTGGVSDKNYVSEGTPLTRPSKCGTVQLPDAREQSRLPEFRRPPPIVLSPITVVPRGIIEEDIGLLSIASVGHKQRWALLLRQLLMLAGDHNKSSQAAATLPWYSCVCGLCWYSIAPPAAAANVAGFDIEEHFNVESLAAERVAAAAAATVPSTAPSTKNVTTPPPSMSASVMDGGGASVQRVRRTTSTTTSKVIPARDHAAILNRLQSYFVRLAAIYGLPLAQFAFSQPTFRLSAPLTSLSALVDTATTSTSTSLRAQSVSNATASIGVGMWKRALISTNPQNGGSGDGGACIQFECTRCACPTHFTILTARPSSNPLPPALNRLASAQPPAPLGVSHGLLNAPRATVTRQCFAWAGIPVANKPQIPSTESLRSSSMLPELSPEMLDQWKAEAWFTAA